MLHLLIGPDTFAKQHRLTQLTTNQPKIRLDATEQLTTSIESIGQADLFGQAPAVIIDNTLKLNTADAKRFTNHLSANLQTSQTIIIPLDDKPTAKHPLTTIMPSAKTEQFPAPTTAQVVTWLQKQAADLGVAIDRRLAPQLALHFNNNKFALLTELQRISWQDNPSLTADQLSQIPPIGTESTMFGLTDAWATRQTAKTLQQLQQLWGQQVHPLAAITMLERQARLLYTAHLAQQDSIPASNWANQLSIAPFIATKLKGWLPKWQPAQLQQALHTLYHLDTQIKSSQIDPQFGVELWIIESLEK